MPDATRRGLLVWDLVCSDGGLSGRLHMACTWQSSEHPYRCTERAQFERASSTPYPLLLFDPLSPRHTPELVHVPPPLSWRTPSHAPLGPIPAQTPFLAGFCSPPFHCNLGLFPLYLLQAHPDPVRMAHMRHCCHFPPPPSPSVPSIRTRQQRVPYFACH